MSIHHPEGLIAASQPLPMSAEDVFAALREHRVVAQRNRAAYHEEVHEMQTLCKQLHGVELRITGRIHGRNGTAVYSDDPQSVVEDLPVRVGSARVETYEGHYGKEQDNLPFIELVARTIETNEMVCARLGVNDAGVTAELIQTQPIES
jgi:hypothetical protein